MMAEHGTWSTTARLFRWSTSHTCTTTGSTSFWRAFSRRPRWVSRNGIFGIRTNGSFQQILSSRFSAADSPDLSRVGLMQSDPGRGHPRGQTMCCLHLDLWHAPWPSDDVRQATGSHRNPKVDDIGEVVGAKSSIKSWDFPKTIQLWPHGPWKLKPPWLSVSVSMEVTWSVRPLFSEVKVDRLEQSHHFPAGREAENFGATS